MAFNTDATKKYERWFLTPGGMYVDDKEKELLLTSMRFKRGETVLNIGSGTGRYIEYLTDLGLNVWGVEPVPELVKMAVRKSAIDPARVMINSYESLVFGDSSFDHVILITTLGFAADREESLREAYRVAKKKVAIGFLNRHSLSSLLPVKQHRAVYTKTAHMTGSELKALVFKALSGLAKTDVEIKYTLYLPVSVGYLVQFVDDVLENFNLPFGAFGMMVIHKKNEEENAPPRAPEGK
ncbi:MAG TPA: class I SAM-dependent methyltransferase [bacterium]|nr:class I SAM-dependent methyltransferase [bacterium]